MTSTKNIAIYILCNLETEDQMLDRILGEEIENNISVNK